MHLNSRAFVNQIVVCLLVTIVIGGSAGLTLVWARHQNSSLAKSNSDLSARIAAVERRNDDMAGLIQSEMRPDLLRKQNNEMRLGLVPMNEVPIIHVTENVVERMAERANRGFLQQEHVGPVRVKFAGR
ncbi:MAG: hypothetical protein JNK23_01400 [Opitutaceae bacterium]|nr:hypothetical protein [Opitutaceae bacterium]